MAVAYLALRAHRRPPELAALLDRVLPFEPDVVHAHEAGPFTLTAWVKDPGLWPAARWSTGDGGAAVVAGYGFHGTSDRLLGAETVRTTASFADLWRACHGEWSACRVGRDGIVATSSAVGSEHVYHASGGGFSAVSNRARLLWATMRAFGEQPAPDLETLASLVSVRHPVCTDRTAVLGVRLLDANATLALAPTGAFEVRSLGLAHLEPSREPPDWERLAALVAGNVAWLRDASPPCMAALTGGKDSRLVLAALRRAGALGKVRFYVAAPPDHADAIVARTLADRFGFSFERRDPATNDRFFDDLRAHVAFTEGALNAWDLKVRDDYGSQVGIHGLLGELYRGRPATWTARPRLAARLLPESIDVGRVVRRHVRAGERRRTQQWIEALGRLGMDASRLRDLFYLQQRIPRWMGQAKLRDGLSGLHHNPLHHPEIVRAYASLAAPDRTSERVHFELMLRLWPELVSEPFALDRWSREMVRASSAPATRVADEPVHHARPMLGTGWQVPTVARSWREIEQRIGDRVARIEGILRPPRVQAFLATCALLLGAHDSAVHWARAALRSPLELYGARRRPAAMLQQLLGVLTVLELCDELASDEPARVKVS